MIIIILNNNKSNVVSPIVRARPAGLPACACSGLQIEFSIATLLIPGSMVAIYISITLITSHIIINIEIIHIWFK